MGCNQSINPSIDQPLSENEGQLRVRCHFQVPTLSLHPVCFPRWVCAWQAQKACCMLSK